MIIELISSAKTTATKSKVDAHKPSTGKNFGTEGSHNTLKESHEQLPTNIKETETQSEHSFATRMLNEGKSHDNFELKQPENYGVSVTHHHSKNKLLNV